MSQKIATGLLGQDDGEQVELFSLGELVPFHDHPFQVNHDQGLEDLKESISAQGVAVPILVREHPQQRGQYEIVAGHRRVEACRLLELETIPGFIRDLDEEEAILFMVDTNIQREELRFSEKAFAYKMKLEALKRQGKRTDLTCGQVGHPTNDETTCGQVGHPINDETTCGQVGHQTNDETTCGQVGHPTNDETTCGQVGHQTNDETTCGQVGHPTNDETTCGQVGHKYKGRDLVAEGTADSARNIQRYIRLTYLEQPLLDMVDSKTLPFLVGVELSYLKPAEQICLLQKMKDEGRKPSLAQATALKEISKEGGVTQEVLRLVFQEEKPKMKKLSLQSDVREFFPPDTSSKEMEAVILDLLRRWKKEQ